MERSLAHKWCYWVVEDHVESIMYAAQNINVLFEHLRLIMNGMFDTTIMPPWVARWLFVYTILNSMAKHKHDVNVCITWGNYCWEQCLLISQYVSLIAELNSCVGYCDCVVQHMKMRISYCGIQTSLPMISVCSCLCQWLHCD